MAEGIQPAPPNAGGKKGRWRRLGRGLRRRWVWAAAGAGTVVVPFTWFALFFLLDPPRVTIAPAWVWALLGAVPYAYLLMLPLAYAAGLRVSVDGWDWRGAVVFALGAWLPGLFAFGSMVWGSSVSLSPEWGGLKGYLAIPFVFASTLLLLAMQPVNVLVALLLAAGGGALASATPRTAGPRVGRVAWIAAIVLAGLGLLGLAAPFEVDPALPRLLLILATGAAAAAVLTVRLPGRGPPRPEQAAVADARP